MPRSGSRKAAFPKPSTARAAPVRRPPTAAADTSLLADVRRVLGQLADVPIVALPADSSAVERPSGISAAAPDEANAEQHLPEAFEALGAWVGFYEACAGRAQDREVQAVNREAEAAGQLAEVTAQSADLDRRLAAANAAHTDAEQRLDAIRDAEQKLEVREEKVREAERRADLGFRQRAAQAEAALAAELDAKRYKAIDELHAAAAAQDVDIKLRHDRLARDRDGFEQEAARQQAAIEAQRAEVHDAESALSRKRAELHGLEVALDRREAQLDAEVEARAAEAVSELERKLHVARINADADQKMVSDLTTQLEQQNNILVKLGTDDPVWVLDALARVKLENRELKDKLAARMDDDTLERLRWLEDQNRNLNSDRERLSYEAQELRGILLDSKINNLQVAQLDKAQQHFDAMTRGYEMRIKELRSTLDDLNRDRVDPTAPLFPNCVNMDDDLTLQESGVLVDDPPDLAELARSLQRVMFTRSRRKYRLNDVCFVLGGMAMSNLHLLQGMSGIGKTSLPKALAEALGTACSVIEVQAGWRDRTDLFGNHNTFDRTFEETSFLLALYRAQTPRYRHRPYFIVLDEMNLSRPEQYFSVILSKLENEDGEPIRLVPTKSGRIPSVMAPDGTGIPVPPNVWFIGTANHDESTLEFADKTYNRSFVLELPANRPRVPGRHGKVEPYSMKALRIAFAAARKAQPDAVNAAKNFIDAFGPDLREDGEIEIAPRVQDQLADYVPVVVAAGAGFHADEQLPDESGMDGAGMAVDQFLATKVLRSLRAKFEVNADRVRRLEERLLEHWGSYFEGLPIECIRLLKAEVRRRDG